MKENNFNNEPKSNAERMLFVLPKSCSCNTCTETKNYVKNEIGESSYRSLCKQAGLNS